MPLISQNSSRWKTLRIMSHTKPLTWLNANGIGFWPVMATVSSPNLFRSYYNLNCFKDLSVMLIFATPSGGNICIKHTILSAQTKVEISGIQQKVLNSDFYLRSRSKPHLQNCLIDSKGFLTQTAQDKRHNKSKITSQVRWAHFQVWPPILPYPFFLGHTVHVSKVLKETSAHFC